MEKYSDLIIHEILNLIEEKNPRHGKKIKSSLDSLPKEFFDSSEVFFKKYKDFLALNGKNLEFAIKSYLRMVRDTMYEQLRFIETGKYSCQSFDDAYKNVYNNPEVMEYYMHGLMVSQFLWKHHYQIFDFFRTELQQNYHDADNYLEVGGGHGLYLHEASKIIQECNFTCIDISSKSIEIATQFSKTDKIKYLIQDIFTFRKEREYDFITMGEVLEHVENPVELLNQLHYLLTDDGYCFITTPANAPAIDHLFLFHDVKHIESIISQAGFNVVKSISLITEEAHKHKLEEYKVPIMYGAIIKKK